MALVNNLKYSTTTPFRILINKYSLNNYRAFSNEETTASVGGYAKAFDKFEEMKVTPKETEQSETFASLLRRSKFIDVDTLVLIYNW